MKYLVLLMADGELPAWESLTPEQQEPIMGQFGEFSAACAAREGVEILAGEALASGDTATVVKTRGGERMITDGPYAEAVEQLGGFYLIEAPDLDVLLDLLQSLPAYDLQISPAVDVG